MQAAKQHLSRRSFFLTILAAPAALAACSSSPTEPAALDPGSAVPAAPQPRVSADPPPPVFAALRRVPLDRDVEPFGFEATARVRLR